MAVEPRADLRVFVRGVVVEDGVDRPPSNSPTPVGLGPVPRGPAFFMLAKWKRCEVAGCALVYRIIGHTPGCAPPPVTSRQDTGQASMSRVRGSQSAIRARRARSLSFQFGSSFRISDAKAKGFFTRCVISWIRSCCRPIRLMASGYRRAHEIIADQIIAQSVKRQVTGGFGRGSGRRSSLRGKLWFISGFPICGTILTGSVP